MLKITLLFMDGTSKDSFIDVKSTSCSEETGYTEIDESSEEIIEAMIDLFRQHNDLQQIISETYHTLEYDDEFDIILTNEPDCASYDALRVNSEYCEIIFNAYYVQKSYDDLKSDYLVPTRIKSDTYRIKDSEYIKHNYYKEFTFGRKEDTNEDLPF